MPQWRVTILMGLVSCGLTISCASQDSTKSKSADVASAQAIVAPTVIALADPLHFTAPDGSEVVVPAGTYHVDQGPGAQLQLLPPDAAQGIVLATQSIDHGFDLTSPVALIVPADDGQQHVILLQPGGKALDALGSASGVITRSPLQPVSPSRLSDALNVKASQASSPAILGRIDPSKMRIPVNLSVQPAAPPGLFQDCGLALSGGYLDTVYTQQVNPGAPHNPNLDNASGTPFIRMTAASRKEFRCAIGTVAVKPTTGSLGPGDQVQLRIVSYVYGYGAWVQDRYQLTPSSNAPLTFPKVIMATFDLGLDPNQFQQHEDTAVKSLATGYLVGVEVFLNGGLATKLPCLLKVPAGGAGTLVCAANVPLPPGM